MKQTILILIFCSSQLIFSAQAKNPILSSYWIAPHDNLMMKKISQKFEIVKKYNSGYEILVPLNEAKTLLELIPGAELLEMDISREFKQNYRGNIAGYHDFDSVQNHMKSIPKVHPELASIEEYGKSMEGRPLWALKLSSSSKEPSKPAILLTAATHGDELITVEVLFGLLDSLVANYGKDDRLTHLIDKYEIYFIPVVNPDGYTRRERYANGVDPNRDYPWPEDPKHKSNPCISAMMNFYDSHHVKAGIDFHASGEMIMYPWAYTYDSLPSYEDNIFDSITSRMAAFNNYLHGPISKVIYVAQGSSADYFHWKHHSWALGIEVGRSKIPSPLEISKITTQNTESTWTFIESIN
jgi:hypothetical protein